MKPNIAAVAFLTLATVGPTVLAATSEVVPLFISASNVQQQQGFVRIINHSDESGTVTVTAVDDDGQAFRAQAFTLAAWETKHFNSNDLEQGNAAKGFSGIGSGVGDWWLEVESDLRLEVLAYVRTRDGFLTSMHDTARKPGLRHRVPIFNPGSNRSQVSKLRLINTASAEAAVQIVGVDDDGSQTGEVRVLLRGRQALTISARQLEDGGSWSGSLGDGTGKWQLSVSADQPVIVMSLLESLDTGHLTNLSTTTTAQDYDLPNDQPSIAVVGDFLLDAPEVEHTFGPAGLVYAEGMFYVYYEYAREVHAYTDEGVRHPEADFSALGIPERSTWGLPEFRGGICYADGRFYIVTEDRLRARAVAYTADGGRSPDFDFDLSALNATPGGIVWADGRFYVPDFVTSRVHVYSADGAHLAGAAFDLDPLRFFAPRGITYAQGRLYILTGSVVVAAYTTSGRPVESAHFDVALDNAGATDITYANRTFYVPSFDTKKVFAYTLAGQRVE